MKNSTLLPTHIIIRFLVLLPIFAYAITGQSAGSDSVNITVAQDSALSEQDFIASLPAEFRNDVTIESIHKAYQFLDKNRETASVNLVFDIGYRKVGDGGLSYEPTRLGGVNVASFPKDDPSKQGPASSSSGGGGLSFDHSDLKIRHIELPDYSERIAKLEADAAYWKGIRDNDHQRFEELKRVEQERANHLTADRDRLNEYDQSFRSQFEEFRRRDQEQASQLEAFMNQIRQNTQMMAVVIAQITTARENPGHLAAKEQARESYGKLRSSYDEVRDLSQRLNSSLAEKRAHTNSLVHEVRSLKSEYKDLASKKMAELESHLADSTLAIAEKHSELDARQADLADVTTKIEDHKKEKQKAWERRIYGHTLDSDLSRHYLDHATMQTVMNDAQTDWLIYEMGEFYKRIGKIPGQHLSQAENEEYLEIISESQLYADESGISLFESYVSESYDKFCFPGDTGVLTRNGIKRISELVPSKDLLWTCDFEASDKPCRLNPLTEVGVTANQQLWSISTDKGEIKATWNHKFFIESIGWLPTFVLKPSMHLRSFAGDQITIIAVRPLEEYADVYDLTVRGAGNFYVAIDSLEASSQELACILAHNCDWLVDKVGKHLALENRPGITAAIKGSSTAIAAVLGPKGFKKIKNYNKLPKEASTRSGNPVSIAKPTGLDVGHSSSAFKPAPRELPAFKDAIPTKKKTPLQGGGKLRARWKDGKGEIYEWDYQHGTVEKYNKRGKHLGEFDANTGEPLKPADPTRRIDP